MSVTMGMIIMAADVDPPAIPAATQTTIVISGTDSEVGIFYHPDIGKSWFEAIIVEADIPGDIIGEYVRFYDDMGEDLFTVLFGYDSKTNIYAPATAYNLYLPSTDTPTYTERGYYIEGEFIQSNLAPVFIL